MNTFEVSLWADGNLVKQVVDNQPDQDAAHREARRIVALEHPSVLDIEIVDYLTIYMGPSTEQTPLPGVE